MSKLVTPDGQILVTGIKDLIAPVTEDEQKKFEAIHFSIQDIQSAVGAPVNIYDDPVKTVGLAGSLRASS